MGVDAPRVFLRDSAGCVMWVVGVWSLSAIVKRKKTKKKPTGGKIKK